MFVLQAVRASADAARPVRRTRASAIAAPKRRANRSARFSRGVKSTMSSALITSRAT